MTEVGVIVEVATVRIGFVGDCSYPARQIVVLAEKVVESSIISQVTPTRDNIRCKPKPLDVRVEFPHL
jgi:hypothetical protein